MNILILSRKATYYSTKALKQAALAGQHSVLVVDPLKCTLAIRDKKPVVYAGLKELTGLDAVIPRIGTVGLEYALAVVQHFEDQKVPVLNSASAIMQAKNKFASLQILNSAGLPVPRTVLIRSIAQVKKAVTSVGNFPDIRRDPSFGGPVVLKLLKGSQGIGVILAKTLETITAILNAVWALDYDVIIQEFIPEAGGQDIRVLVLGEQVIAAMRRRAKKNEFRSNIHCGGSAEKIVLPLLYQKLAVRAARALKLQFAGVDLIESARGPLIIEVNASPGFEEMERVTGINIAKKVINFSVKFARESLSFKK
ncbi:MAG: RimK family alpha-L-glutamate ligase [Planctomycetota bacterium]